MTVMSVHYKATMVLIVPPRGESFAIDVNPNATTLHDLKVAIEQHHGTPVLDQHLFLSHSLGENDSDLISNLGIGPSSTLTLHVGGTTTPPSIVGSSEDTIGSNSKEEEELDKVKTAAKEGKEESDKKAPKEEEESVRFIMYLSDEDDYVGCHPVENLIHTDPYLRRNMNRHCAEMEELKQARLKKDLEEIAIELDLAFKEELDKGMEKVKKNMEDRNKWIENFKKARKEKIAKEGKEDESDNKAAKEEEESVRFVKYLSDEDDYVGCHPVENLIHTDPYLRRNMKRHRAEMEELKQVRLKKDLEEIAIELDLAFKEELDKGMEIVKKNMEDRNKWIENFKKARKEKIAKEGKEESEDD